MKRLESEHPHFKKGKNSCTSGEMEEEDEELEEVDKEQRDLTYVETVTSRTISYHRKTTLERSSKIMTGDRRTYTRWGPSVEDEKVLNDIPTESTSTSSHTPVNLEDLEKEATEVDEELKKMIKRGGKSGVNLDAIEERSEKRKKIREAIQARRLTQKEEDRHRESKKSNEKQSLIPYKPEKKEEYTVIVRNLRSRLKTKEEMYKYLLTFGDICRINYMD